MMCCARALASSTPIALPSGPNMRPEMMSETSPCAVPHRPSSTTSSAERCSSGTPCEDLREQLAVAVEPAAARGRAGCVDGLLGGVLEHQAVHLGMLDAPVEVGGDPAAQRRGGRAAFLGGVLGVGEGLEGAVDRRLEELVLVLVVEVDRGARVAETARDLEQGELLGALLLDDLGGHAKDVVRELRVGRSCGHGGPP